MEGKQGYVKGMDQDSSFTKRDSNSYFAAHNFKVVTDGGSSAGTLETEKGTKLAFKVPDLLDMTLTSGEVIPAQANLRIIGSCTMVDDIIIFTTNETSITPSGYGQIWRCKYDEESQTIIGLLPGNTLDPSVHLFYNQALNFSTEYRIGRAIALYETKDKQRVYWTDNYNQVRTFNLAVDNSLDVDITTLDLFPGALLPQPVLNRVIAGNLPSATQIQFTYRLINTGGGESAYAPPTPMIPLPEQALAANSFTTWTGGGSAINKAVSYYIQGLDTAYNVIEHIAILYDANGILVGIYKFSEDTIPSTGDLTILCSSITGATEIPIEEYSLIETGFSRCKDIEVQGNRLIAANLSTDKNEFDFDARAYRFNSPGTKYLPESPAFPLGTVPNTPIALLQDTNNNNDDLILLGGTNTPDWDSVPLTHDCVNIFNKEQEADWFNLAQQYKYQADGITVGGEGKNIKYEFTTIDMVGNKAFDSQTAAPNHVTIDSNAPLTAPLYKGKLQKDGTPEPIYVDNQLGNMAGHWAHMNYTGYARGEIYRFGLVLYDLKGVPKFVEWIGDIKFPDVSDGYPLQRMINGEAVLQQLGIKFSIDVSSIADQISGYSIVRLERNEIDKTKLGTGFFMYFNVQDPNTSNSLMHRYFITGLGGGSGDPVNDPFPVTGSYQYFGDNGYNFMHLPDRPGENNLIRQNDVYTRVANLISPFGNFYTSPHTVNDYIETLEYYNAELFQYYSHPGGTGDFGTDSDFGFFYKMGHRQAPYHSLERIQVQKSKDLYPGQVILKGDEFMDDLDTSSSANLADLSNTSYTREKKLFISGSKEYVPLGIGTYRRALRLNVPATLSGTTDLTPTIPHAIYETPKWQNVSNGGTTSADVYWYGPDYPGNGMTLNFFGSTKASEELTFKSVGYRRYLDQQYKGASYEVRSTDQYLYIGHHQLTGHPNNQQLTTEVYGGDTYVNYYDEEYIERYTDSTDQNILGVFKDHGINKLSVAVCGPVESAVNTNWRFGSNWAKDRDTSDMDNYSMNSNYIYPVWNKEDDVQNKFFSEDFLSQFVEEHPFQLWASNIKINGELIDSWRNFPIANKTEVDGIYGPINRLLSFKDNLMFYQDRAFGIASLDERSVIQDDSGQELVLGTGGVFPDYKYVSTNTGTVHQFSVVDSESAVYHYDARLKKFFQFTGSAAPLSDMKGMSSFFAKEVTGSITSTDKTLRDIGNTGVHGIYDQRFNRVLYTFSKGKPAQFLEYYLDKFGDYVFPDDSYIQVGSTTYYVELGVQVEFENIDYFLNSGLIKKVTNAFTIGYNELTQSFESFYDYHPNMYLEYGRRLLSISPFENNELHEHNIGLPGQYYDKINSVSRLHTIFSQPGDINKVWNNIGFSAELYDQNGEDIYNETIDRMQFKNNYQDTGVIDLVPGENIQRRMRTWRTIIPREIDKELSRMRNPWLECVLEYDNNSGKRHILHDLIYSFTPTRM